MGRLVGFMRLRAAGMGFFALLFGERADLGLLVVREVDGLGELDGFFQTMDGAASRVGIGRLRLIVATGRRCGAGVGGLGRRAGYDLQYGGGEGGFG